MRTKLTLIFVLLFVGLFTTVYCQAPPTHNLIIGAGNTNLRTPFNVYNKTSIFETIYLKSELDLYAGSTIEKITLFNNYKNSLYNKPTKIWLGNTTQNSLGYWIPANQLTLVYDGTQNYPSGSNPILFNLQQHFVYGGDNLVMLVYRPMDTEYYSALNYFKCSHSGALNRNLYYSNDTVEIDPNAPPPTFTENDYREYYPNIVFNARFPIASAAPNPPQLIYPMPNGESILPRTVFTWDWDSSGDYAYGYKFYLGTDNPPTNIVNGEDLGYVKNFSPDDPLELDTTYYWMVESYNSIGVAVDCPVQSFHSFSTASFAGGIGSSADPWQITTVEHLYLLRYYLGQTNSDKHFKLMNNLNLDTIPWNYGNGWEPIGDSSEPFRGTLNGNNKTISGMRINRNDGYRGIFGFFSGTVKNLKVTNSSIAYSSTSSLSYCGLIAGYMVHGSIENCYAQGTVSANYGGLLCGFLDWGSIIDCWVEGSVVGSNPGALTGTSGNPQHVINSYYNYENVLLNGANRISYGALYPDMFDDWFTDRALDINDYLIYQDGFYQISSFSDLTALLAFGSNDEYHYALTNDVSLEQGFYIPYLVGRFNGNGHTINNLYLNQDISNLGFIGRYAGPLISNLTLQNAVVNGVKSAGILIAINTGNVSNCITYGTVNAHGIVGGLIGAVSEGVISDCVNHAIVTGNGGGLVGYLTYGQIVNCYNTGHVSQGGGLVGSSSRYEGITNSFYDYETVLVEGEHCVTYGAIPSAMFSDWINNNKSLNINDYFNLQGGKYVIDSIQKLKYLLGFAASNHNFILTAHLNIASAFPHETDFHIPYFTGNLDGNSKAIHHTREQILYTSESGGLFELVSPEAEISKLALLNSSPLVSLNQGLVRSCFITGDGIEGNYPYLIYANYGTMQDCFSTTGNPMVQGGSASNSYSVNSPVMYDLHFHPQLSNCYFNLDNVNLEIYLHSHTSPYARTTQEMTSPYASNTYQGWDFYSTWVSNNGYPLLAFQSNLANARPLPVTNKSGGNLVFPNILRWDIQTTQIASMPYGFRLSLGSNAAANNILSNVDIGWRMEYNPFNHALNPNTTYYWKLVPYNQHGVALDCPIWTFVARNNPDPVAATDPVPANNSTDIELGLQNLSWKYVHPNYHSLPLGFKVFIQFDTEDFRDFVWVPYVNGQSNYSLNVPMELDYGTYYYWKVVPTTDNEARNATSFDEILQKSRTARIENARMSAANLQSRSVNTHRATNSSLTREKFGPKDNSPKGETPTSQTWNFRTADDPYPGFILLTAEDEYTHSTALLDLVIRPSENIYIDPRIDNSHEAIPTLLNYEALEDSLYTILGFSRGPLVPVILDTLVLTVPEGIWYARLFYANTWHLSNPPMLDVSTKSPTGTFSFAGIAFTANSEVLLIVARDTDPTTLQTITIDANEPTEVQGQAGPVTVEASSDIVIDPNIGINHPVIVDLPNYANFTEYVVFGISGEVPVLESLQISVGPGTWYGRIYFGGQWHQSVPPSIIVADGSVGSLTFYNIEFGAKGVTIVFISKGHDPTLPVYMSSFTASPTVGMFVRVQWVTESETNISGYNLYRNQTEDVDSALLINSGLIWEGTASGGQTQYSYLDREVKIGIYYYWLESVELNGTNSIYGPISATLGSEHADPGVPEIPLVTMLLSAFPNPFNPETNIRYSISEAATVKIQIYNTRGQLIRTFKKTHENPGYYSAHWDGKDESGRMTGNGIYFYRMLCPGYQSTRKMIMIK